MCVVEVLSLSMCVVEVLSLLMCVVEVLSLSKSVVERRCTSIDYFISRVVLATVYLKELS